MAKSGVELSIEFEEEQKALVKIIWKTCINLQRSTEPEVHEVGVCDLGEKLRRITEVFC